MKYMLDTNIFNNLLDDKIDIEDFKENIVCYTTHIQLDEINKTKCEMRREKLNSVFSIVQAKSVSTENLALDISKFDIAKIGDGLLYQEIKNYLDSLNKRKKHNERDALIAETAIKNNLILVTHDTELLEATKKFNGNVAKLT